jgi:PAS domain S-box-containing protein
MNMLNFAIWGALVLVCTTGLVFLLISNMAVRSGEMPFNPIGATEVTHADERTTKPVSLHSVARGSSTQDTMSSIAGDATRLRQFLEAMPIGVVVFDDQHRVQYWNRHCEIIFGWRAVDVLGRTPWQSYAPEIGTEQADSMLKRLHAQHENYALARDARRRDGSLRHCTWVVSPERDEQGNLVRALALVQDITEQRRADTAQADYAADISALARQLLDHDAQITRRLAQTLHDRLGQTLTALRMAFDVVDANSACPVVWQDSPMGPLIDQAVKEVRDALTELRPPLLNEQGLHDALDNEIRSHWRNPNRVRIALTSEGEDVKDRYPSDVEYAAFMIAREAVGNALRHAKPHHVGVHMSGPKGKLTVEIKDDGLGFDGSSELPKPGHLGLVGMRERALAVGAQLTVKSLTGVGSCVRFEWLAVDPEDVDEALAPAPSVAQASMAREAAFA